MPPPPPNVTGAQISALLIVWSAVGFAAEIPSGAVADRFSRRRTLVASGVLQAAGYVLLDRSVQRVLGERHGVSSRKARRGPRVAPPGGGDKPGTYGRSPVSPPAAPPSSPGPEESPGTH
ncbi:MAG: hypothetical protein ACRDKW_04405 [Actinomycetota bacterium]